MTEEKDAFMNPEPEPLAPLADAPAKETVDRIKEAVNKASENQKEGNK